MILNLVDLNEFVAKKHFKMDTFETALHMITKNCYFASLDYTDAYYSIAIDKNYRKYLLNLKTITKTINMTKKKSILIKLVLTSQGIRENSFT